MSEIGIGLAASGSRTSLAADPGATRLTGGTVPLAKIAALEAPLTEARQSLRTSSGELGRIDATWLVPPIDDKLSDLRAKVARAARDAETGIQAAHASYRPCWAPTGRPVATSSRSRPRPSNARRAGSSATTRW